MDLTELQEKLANFKKDKPIGVNILISMNGEGISVFIRHKIGTSSQATFPTIQLFEKNIDNIIESIKDE